MSTGLPTPPYGGNGYAESRKTRNTRHFAAFLLFLKITLFFYVDTQHLYGGALRSTSAERCCCRLRSARQRVLRSHQPPLCSVSLASPGSRPAQDQAKRVERCMFWLRLARAFGFYFYLFFLAGRERGLPPGGPRTLGVTFTEHVSPRVRPPRPASLESRRWRRGNTDYSNKATFERRTN